MYRETSPTPRCAGLVAQRWHYRAAATSPDEAGRVLPDGCTDIVADDSGGVWIFGPACTFRNVRAGSSHLGIRLRPQVVRAVFRTDPWELQDRKVPLGELWPQDFSELADLARAGSHPEALHARLESLLLRRAYEPDLAERKIERAIAVLRHAPHPSIADLAEQLSWSERQFRRQFLRHVGMNIKTFGRIARFQRLTDELRFQRRHPEPCHVEPFDAEAHHAEPFRASWARLATEYGYADQAHLVRETQRLAGLSPTRLLRQL